MMYNAKRVEDILRERKRYFENNTGWLYPDETHGCKVYETQRQTVEKVLSGEESFGSVFTLFNNFSEWHLRHAEYQILQLDQSVAARNEFAKSAIYGYLAVKKGKESAGCWICNVFLYMSRASFYMARNMLCGWWDRAWDIANIINESVDFGIVTDEKGNKVKRIITCDETEVPASWFLLELFHKVKGSDFNRDNAEYPELMTPYAQVLEKWDTDDLTDVDRSVYNMADRHLEQAKEPTGENDEHPEFESAVLWLFPYEILAWLALRKKAGLENPKEFSHPLMNTPLAKMFLELETPLPEPAELPYADELVAKLVENCPKMTGETEPEDKTPKSPTVLKTAPKTGRYRATLPEGHPQAEALRIDPLAYRTYKAGERFSNAGLEEYEANKIEWVFVE